MLQDAFAHGLWQSSNKIVDGNVRVPDPKRVHSGESPHVFPVTARRTDGTITGFVIGSPIERAASAIEAASRFTSHSHGTDRVSSKSLMSKMMLRSGVAKPPKFMR